MTPLAILTFVRSHWKLIALTLFAAWAMRVNYLRGHYKAQLVECRHDKEQFTFSVQAQTKAEASRQKGIADVADTKHKMEAPSIRAATDDFIASHRVRREETGNSSAPATDKAAGVPESLSAYSGVVVEDSDVQACSEWVHYGMSARDWALDLAGGGS